MERTGLWIFSMSLVRYWGDKQKQRLLLVDKVFSFLGTNFIWLHDEPANCLCAG